MIFTGKKISSNAYAIRPTHQLRHFTARYNQTRLIHQHRIHSFISLVSKLLLTIYRRIHYSNSIRNFRLFTLRGCKYTGAIRFSLPVYIVRRCQLVLVLRILIVDKYGVR